MAVLDIDLCLPSPYPLNHYGLLLSKSRYVSKCEIILSCLSRNLSNSPPSPLRHRNRPVTILITAQPLSQLLDPPSIVLNHSLSDVHSLEQFFVRLVFPHKPGWFNQGNQGVKKSSRSQGLAPDLRSIDTIYGDGRLLVLSLSHGGRDSTEIKGVQPHVGIPDPLSGTWDF